MWAAADTVERLDLSGNALTALPDEFARLRRLRVLFLSGNPLGCVPAVLGGLPELEVLGLRGCDLHEVPPAALPPRLRWLILTGNRLASLPDELGRRPRLEKLALAGNRLTSLPDTLAACDRLALIRAGANDLRELPAWLPRLPRMAYLSFAGNLAIDGHQRPGALPTLPRSAIVPGARLGGGASGDIHACISPAGHAVKIFKQGLTSDGWPEREIAAWSRAGTHPALIPAQVLSDDGGCLLMPLLEDGWRCLGLVPTMQSCSRDVIPAGLSLDARIVQRIVAQVAEAVTHLHAQGLVHGDCYAHNILFRADGSARLGDFGAASFLPKDPALADACRACDVLALAHLIDDLLPHATGDSTALRDLHEQLALDPAGRPSAAWLAARMAG